MSQEEFNLVLEEAEKAGDDDALRNIYGQVDAERRNAELEYLDAERRNAELEYRDTESRRARAKYVHLFQLRMLALLTLSEHGLGPPDPEAQAELTRLQEIQKK